MFSKILIANRGEIACRVIDTARRMGVQTVAVFSEADARARHVKLADQAVAIGPAPARDSYLVIERIISAAKSSGAQAIHPGYGFLSENDRFASACADAGIVFIGPPVDAIRSMGLKAESKALMAKAGVPLTPGYHGENQDGDFLREQATQIGYPVLIKASAGGGGKGMRLVESADAFDAALQSCQREASAAFGNDVVLVEKFIERPRHIEIQVFGDTHGNAVHLFERDCSVQRRHQKVLEEAPAPGMTKERRAAMGKAAVDAAKAVGYVGAGTVEFIAGPNGDFYFMEMNTRLQVEHPVTEMITGQDLVQWQLSVAAGEPLPLSQEEIAISGHAVEARVYAEDPARKFMPSTGTLRHLAFPDNSESVRIDTGVVQGDVISPHYDPMIAKVIAYGENRETALARLSDALAQTHIVGVKNNVQFLRSILATHSFANADLDTALLERESAALAAKPDATALANRVMIAVAGELADERMRCRARSQNNPWDIGDAWRMNGQLSRVMSIEREAERFDVTVDYLANGARLSLNGQQCVVRTEALSDGSYRYELNGESVKVRRIADGLNRHLFGPDWRDMLTLIDALAVTDIDDVKAGELTAPMPGKIITLSANPGQTVKQGDPLLVLEAMKMEHTIAAPTDGKLIAFHFNVGEQVQEGIEPAEFEADS